MNLKYDDFGRLEKLDVYMVSQDRKSKVPIQIHNIKIEMRDLEISKVTFDVDEEESIIRDLYTWGKYEGTTWEELAGLTWLDITRSEDYTLFESLRIIYIPALGDKAYFQLSTPNETQENKRNYKSCTAYSLEYQLTQKDVSYFIINMGTIGSNDGVVLYDKLNPDKSLLDLALKNAPNWSVGEVDTSIALKSRSFEIDKSDIYSFLVDDVADAYKCVFLFDTVNCKVNVVALENYGKDTDIHISSKNLAKRIAIESAEDSIFTRFYVEGKDGLDIRDVNLGSDYIEDYSYYNSPEWLGSQELCDKYNDYIGLREMQRALYINKQKENINKLNQYHELMNRVPDNFDSMIWAEYGLIELRAMRDTYQNVVDSQIENGHNSPSHINHDAYLINKKALDDIKAELIVRENEVDMVQLALDNIAIELKQIIDAADKNTYFTKDELMIFSSLEVNTDYSDESYVVTDSMPDEMIMQIKEDLYTSAVKEIYISSHPQYSFKTELLNLFNIPEFKPIKSGFDLGSFVTLSMRDNYHIRLRLIAIDIDFNNLDNLTVEFSNMTRSRDGFDDYMALVKNAINRTSASITRSLNTSMIGVHEELNTIESTVKKGVSYEYLFANYASIGTLEAVNAKIYNLETTYLTAEQANILFLTAEQADIKYANIENLNVVNANIDNLTADIGTINTLLSGNLTSENIQSLHLTALNTVIDNALIKDAMISDLSVDKIKAGDISTNKFNIVSDSGNFTIVDNTIQITDGTKVRVQIGKDAGGDYNMYVWDIAGKLMFDATGITENAIKSAIIRDDMVSPTANIDAKKLNITSLFSEINGSTKTIKSSKVLLDTKEQTLDIAFSQLENITNDNAENLLTQGTQLNMIQGQITSKIWETDITSAINPLNTSLATLTDNYSTLSQTVDSISTTVTSHTSNISTLEDGLTAMDTRVTSAEQLITKDSIVSRVSDVFVSQVDMDSSIDSINTRIASAEQKITTEAIVSTVTSSNTYKNALDEKVSSNSIISSINQSAEEISIEANKVTIGTGTNFERGETYTWEKYAGMSWREVAALRNPKGVDKIYGLPEGTMESAGRNLLQDSAFNDNGWWRFGTGISIDTVVQHNGHNVVKMDKSGSQRLNVYPENYPLHEIGTPYTLSFWVMSPDVSLITATMTAWIKYRDENLSNNGANTIRIAPNDFQKAGNGVWFKIIATYTSYDQEQFYITSGFASNSTTGTIYISEPKLEKTTPWLEEQINLEGRNLIPNSNFSKDVLDGWTSPYGTYQIKNSFNILTLTSAHEASRVQYYTDTLEPGIYTFSMLAKSEKGFRYDRFDGTEYEPKAVEGSQGFKISYITFEVTEPQQVYIRMYFNNPEVGDAMEIDWVKLEKGSTATPWNPALEEVILWTPAPEDVEGVPCTWLEASRSPEYSPALISRTLEKISASLGSMEYFDESAFYGETIIVGGFLNTNLIMANSIVANHIASGAITADKIQAGAITADKIQAGAITADKITTKSITTDKLNITSLSSVSSNIGTITSGKITGTEINNGNGTFRVDVNGNMVATNADIKGKITATSGSFTGSITSSSANITGGTVNITTASSTESKIITKYSGWSNKMSPYGINATHTANNAEATLSAGGLFFERLDGTRTNAIFNGNGMIVYGNNMATIAKLDRTGLSATGTKNRIVSTKNYGNILLNAYETPRPTFADTGHAQIGDDGLCYIDIDLIFLETIDHTHSYRYFLTKYGQGELWIKESTIDYFVVEGTPNLRFDWKVEAIQKDYNTYNMEQFEGEGHGIEETDYVSLADEYLRENEKEMI